jgi:hypothetical protein
VAGVPPAASTVDEIQMKRRKRMSTKTAGPPEPPSFDPPGALGRDIQAKIGDQLRALHDDIVRQGVPDRFVELLSRLDKTGDKGE